MEKRSKEKLRKKASGPVGIPSPVLGGVDTAYLVSFALHGLAGLLAFGSEINRSLMERLKRSHRRVSQFSGVIFVLVGINDTLTYWFL